MQPANTPPLQSTTPGLHPRKHSPDVATRARKQTSDYALLQKESAFSYYAGVYTVNCMKLTQLPLSSFMDAMSTLQGYVQ